MIEGGGERLKKEGEKGGREENRREEREEERGIKMNQDKHEWKSHLEVVLLGITVIVWIADEPSEFFSHKTGDKGKMIVLYHYVLELFSKNKKSIHVCLSWLLQHPQGSNPGPY